MKLKSSYHSLKQERVYRQLVVVIFLLLMGCDFTPTFEEFDQQVGADIEEDSCGGVGILCDVAGVAGEAGVEGLGGDARTARLNHPVDVAMAPLTLAQTGEIYVLDWQNHAVRKITRDKKLFPFIGTGRAGDGTSGEAEGVDLNLPSDLTVGPNGHFYLTDWQNSKIKVFDAIDLSVRAVYGSTEGLAGDGGPAEQAALDRPSSFIFDPDGLMYISDQRNNRIRQIDAQDIITTYAGGEEGYLDGQKEEAQFSFDYQQDASIPSGKISMNTHDWALYIADTENHCIRRLNFFTGLITTVIGVCGEPGYAGDNANARNAHLNAPTDVIFREDHHVYIADSGNHVIRKVDPFGTITTLVGTGEPGFSPDATPASEAMLNSPRGIYYDEVNFLLYIADTFNHQIKRVEDK